MNAYEILARFRRTARKAGWPATKIDAVIQDAMAGDYEHLNEVVAGAYLLLLETKSSG